MSAVTALENATLKAEPGPRPLFETLLAELSARLIGRPAGGIARQTEDTQRLVLAGATRRSGVRRGTLLLALAALGASAAPAKRVLILDSFGRDVAPFSVATAAFRTTLARELGQPVDIYEASLDTARFADPGFEMPLADFLEQRSAGSPVDLVVPVGAPAAQFVVQYRKRLFAETQMVFMGSDPRRLPPGALERNATLVTGKSDQLGGVLEAILQIQPDTANVVFVAGISPFEKFWADEFRREWQPYANRLSFSWLDNLSLQQIQDRVRALPPRSVIVNPMLLVDADRVPYEGNDGFEAVHAAANAPVFGCFMSQLGRGAIGGWLYQDDKVGTQAARVAVRILRGERAADIPPEIIGPSPPTYDWRELKRWGISPDRLPAGSVIEFRESTFWEQYRWHIVGVVGFCCLQTVLIVALLVHRAKRREEQAMATLIADLSSRFINLPADKVDPEIEAAQRRVCDALGLDVSSLWQWRPDNPVMHTLTHYYRPLGGPPVPPTMKGQDFFPWCQRRVLAGEVITVSSLADLPAEAARDREVFSHYGLKTNLTIPLSVGGAPVFGSVNFNDMRKERRWSEALVQRLQLVAQIFANALARKVTDQALQQSEARLSLAADAAAMGLWRLDLATYRFWVTDRARELFKFAPGEKVTWEHFLSLVHPDDQALVRETMRTLGQTGSEGQVQYRVVWPDGSIRWMLSRGRVHSGTTREPECLTGVTIDITERKQAETALHESEEQYRRLFEEMHSGVIVLDVIFDQAGNAVDHRLVQANAQFEAQTGLKREEQIGRTSAELSFQWPDEVRQRYYRVALGGEPLHWQRFNESLKRFFDVRVFSPRRGQFALLFHDITERERTNEALRESERRLRESEARYRGIFDGAIEGLFRTSVEGKLVVANAALARMLGYASAEEAIRVLEDTGLQAWADQDERRRFLQQIEKEGALRAYECQLKRADGTKIWVSLNARAVRGPEGRVAYLDGFVEDISERKRVADALERSENRFRTAFMTGADAFLIAERDTGRMTEVNDRMVALYGYTRDEFIGHTSNELGMWVYPEAREEMLKQLRQHGRIENLEVYARRKNGEPFWVLYSVNELKSEGTPLILGAIHDITERKRREAALERVRWLQVETEKLGKVGGWEFDIDTGKQTWTEETYRIHELDASHQPTVEEGINFYAPGSRPTIQRAVRRAIEHGEPYDVELEIVTAKGNRRDVHAIGKPDLERRRVYGFIQDITERKRIETALRASEERMALAFRGTQDGIWDWNIETDEVFYSLRWKTMLGYDEAEIEPQISAWKRLLHPDDLPRALQVVEEVLRGTREFAMEFRLRHKDGHYVDVLSRGFPVRREANGPIVRIVGTHFDLTERKQAEAALAETQSRYQLLFEAIPESVLLIGTDGRVIAANPASARLYGYDSAKDLEGFYTPLLIAEKDRARATRTQANVVQGKEQPSRRYTEVRRDGSEFIAEVSSATIRGPRQEVLGYLGITHDITAFVEAEAALRESVERFRQVAEIANEFIWEVDANGLYTYASPLVERILGYSPEELVGKMHFYDLFDPSVREELKAAAFRVFADRQIFRDFPNPNLSKSGRIVQLETSGRPIVDAAGTLTGYRGADTDVTERRRVEQEIALQRSRLAHLSRVNTLGELAGSLAHELNQPLTAVLSNAQAAQRFLAHERPDLNEVRDILADIVAEDKRAGEVIHRLRLLLKQGEVRYQPLQVNEVVQEVLKLVRNDLMNNNVTAQTELAPHLPVLQGDRVQLQQVLLNLVMNASDAMTGGARGERQLTVRTRQADDGSIQISVADRGVGLPPDKLEQVFEAFYTTKPHGMGLGLAVCRTIVTAHGGRLWAANNPGRGATFYVALPVNGGGK